MSAPDRLAILLWATDPGQPERCAAPFVYAAVAGAMDCQVEIHFAGPAARLLVDGVAAGLDPAGTGEKSVYAFMQEAAAHGARFLGCGMALRAHVPAGARLIPEYAGSAGAAAFVRRTMDPAWRTLVF